MPPKNFDGLTVNPSTTYRKSFRQNAANPSDSLDISTRFCYAPYEVSVFKLGESEVEEGVKHLCEIERLILEYNKKGLQCPIRLPDLKLVITGTQYGYRRKDGVFVVPIGCLKD